MKYQTFRFKSYQFDTATKTLSCAYGYDDALTFTESFTFDFDHITYDPVALDRAAQLVFFMAGVSYYKAYLSPVISIEAGQVDQNIATFLRQTYQRGLGEFLYVNDLPVNTEVPFLPNVAKTLNMLSVNSAGKLVGLGGGKDSLVSLELLSGQDDVSTWSLGHARQLAPLTERTALPHFQVSRQWDKQLLSLNEQGAYNGHVPISAILATVGTMLAVLTGKQDVVVSNEHSANEPTLDYQGVAVNHQYSKSLEFEQSFQHLLNGMFGDSIRYYSLLRPLSELRISELFARSAFKKYKDVFSSCNRAFTHTSDSMSWCGECPKCAFVFLALTPFVDQSELESLWSGKNLLLDPILEPTYKQLLGLDGDKPLECVGEVKECRAAIHMVFNVYPNLSMNYQFEDPAYDYARLSEHSMPADVFATIADQL